MTYVGLASETANSDELPDYALVFMFCPFGESFAQPISVFGAKGAIRGTILAQLLLQAILLMEKKLEQKVMALFVMELQQAGVCDKHWV